MSSPLHSSELGLSLKSQSQNESIGEHWKIVMNNYTLVRIRDHRLDRKDQPSGERTTVIPQHITATAIVQRMNRVDRPLQLKRRQ